ncbi:hypothetical protein O181_027267 [Austropuccinia psidii MF-1]|uniref:Uncharacterized protein n=1 Tax=Austropuccinia psidii MF-1 TaxID=1389203 RepID=A0A9Q3CPP7_9BASI|nr:hypothetical protein [Austropuccinia psidii MF-1]
MNLQMVADDFRHCLVGLAPHPCLDFTSQSSFRLTLRMASVLQLVESSAYALIDRGWVPDWILRRAIRYLCGNRLKTLDEGSFEERHDRKLNFVAGLCSQPVAIKQDKANEQHYEVPTELMQSVLGSHMKYSACYFPRMCECLDAGEVLMLETYCVKADLRDGMTILDLGCGWGSLCLFLAQKYPDSHVIALSNSRTQKAYIDSLSTQRQLDNLTVHTADVMTFDFPSGTTFDRIISIEMLEHMKNYEYLFEKISRWLKPTGLLFVHTFCHVTQPYHFEEGDGWMAQNFFSGGTMPSHDLFAYFQKHLNLEKSWYINGKHYARTAELWLKRLDSNRAIWLSPAQKRLFLKKGLSEEESRLKVQQNFFRFRTFFLAVAEFFGLNDGESWGVGHYLFSRK